MILLLSTSIYARMFYWQLSSDQPLTLLMFPFLKVGLNQSW
jgi:hypothetical protein